MNTRYILLVDDDGDDQELFEEALQSINPMIEVRLADNGMAALDLLVNDPEYGPDIIFLDLNMPQMNGKQFLTRLKKIEKYKNIPVVIFSTSSSQIDREESDRLGAVDFIIKPNRFEILCEVLSVVLKKNWKSE